MIRVLPGKYFVSAPLTIGPEDSGSRDSPLVIEGADQQSVILTGARIMKANVDRGNDLVLERIPEPARSSTLVFNLAGNGVSNWVAPTELGQGISLPAKDQPSQLFIDGQLATLARWPATGFATIQRASPAGPIHFASSPPLPDGWRYPINLFAFGYWGNDWSSVFLRATAISAADVALTGKTPQFGVKNGQRFFLANVPEALSGPGQWYYDQSEGNIYVIQSPNQPPPLVEVAVTESVISVKGASYVTIRNLTIEDSRADLVDVESASSFNLQNCRLSNAGRVAVTLSSTTDSGIHGCVIERAGGSAVRISAGDRQTLNPGGNEVSDCRITAFGQVIRSSQAAIQLDGVGSRVEHNEISDGPYAAIIFTGNNHYIGRNNIHDVALETGDIGAIYVGRDWTARGTVIEGNFLHDIQGYVYPWASGVYLDDQASGITVRNNLFLRVHRGILVGGGLDNTIVNNVFAKTASTIYMDQRGMNSEKAMSNDANGPLQKNLRSVPIDSEPYRTSFPTLATIAADGFGVPRRNSIERNLVIGGKFNEFHLDGPVLALQGIRDNWEAADQGDLWNRPVDLMTENNPAAFTLSQDSSWVNDGLQPFSLADAGPR